MSLRQGQSREMGKARNAPYGAALLILATFALAMSHTTRANAVQFGLNYKAVDETIPAAGPNGPGAGQIFKLPVDNRRVKVIVTTNYQDGEGIAELNMFYNLNENVPTPDPARLVWVGQHGDPTDAGPAAGFTKDANVAMAWCGRTHSMRIVSAVTSARTNSFRVQNLTGNPRKVSVEMMW